MTRIIAFMAVLGLGVVYAGTAVAADGLGKLFFTPAQRVQLDAARSQRDRRVVPGTESEQATPQGPNIVTYNGLVRRNDGRLTVWINGKPVTERSRDSEVNVLGVRRDGAVSVTVPQAERPASLQVGQSIDVTFGTIEEPYARRTTLYRPPPPKPAPATTPETQPVPIAKPAVRRDTREFDPESGAVPPVVRSTAK